MKRWMPHFGRAVRLSVDQHRTVWRTRCCSEVPERGKAVFASRSDAEPLLVIPLFAAHTVPLVAAGVVLGTRFMPNRRAAVFSDSAPSDPFAIGSALLDRGGQLGYRRALARTAMSNSVRAAAHINYLKLVMSFA